MEYLTDFTITFVRENIAIIFSLCALGLTFYQGTLSRRHNRLSLKPHLIWKTSLVHKEDIAEFKVIFENVGLGPARFHGVFICFGPWSYRVKNQNDLHNFFHDILGRKAVMIDFVSLASGFVMGKDTSEQFFKAIIKYPETPDDLADFQLHMSQVYPLVKYSSLYKEKFQTNADNKQWPWWKHFCFRSNPSFGRNDQKWLISSQSFSQSQSFS